MGKNKKNKDKEEKKTLQEDPQRVHTILDTFIEKSQRFYEDLFNEEKFECEMKIKHLENILEIDEENEEEFNLEE